MQTKPALSAWRSSHLCLSSVGITGVGHHDRLYLDTWTGTERFCFSLSPPPLSNLLTSFGDRDPLSLCWPTLLAGFCKKVFLLIPFWTIWNDGWDMSPTLRIPLRVRKSDLDCWVWLYYILSTASYPAIQALRIPQKEMVFLTLPHQPEFHYPFSVCCSSEVFRLSFA